MLFDGKPFHNGNGVVIVDIWKEMGKCLWRERKLVKYENNETNVIHSESRKLKISVSKRFFDLLTQLVELGYAKDQSSAIEKIGEYFITSNQYVEFNNVKLLLSKILGSEDHQKTT